jgi:hypothetical protein
MRILLLGYILLICSCVIPKEKREVIDGIVLGEKVDNFDSYFDSLGLKKELMYTVQSGLQYSAYSESELQDYLLNGYFTNRFNYSEFNNDHYNINHKCLVQPIVKQKHIIGVRIFLGHFEEPFSNDFNIANVYSQNISARHVKRILSQYNKKYGTSDKDTLVPGPFYVLIRREIKEFGYFDVTKGNNANSKDYYGLLHEWNKEYFNVKFFEGVKSIDATYALKENVYSFLPFSTSHESVNQLFNPIYDDYCNKYSYIEYYLNEKALDKLELNSNSPSGI